MDTLMCGVFIPSANLNLADYRKEATMAACNQRPLGACRLLWQGELVSTLPARG